MPEDEDNNRKSFLFLNNDPLSILSHVANEYYERRQKRLKFDENLLFSKEKLIFTNKENIKEKNRFVCSVIECQKTFTSNYGLRYHEANVHTTKKCSKEKPFYCKFDGCSKRYKNQNGLKYHEKVTHGMHMD